MSDNEFNENDTCEELTYSGYGMSSGEDYKEKAKQRAKDQRRKAYEKAKAFKKKIDQERKTKEKERKRVEDQECLRENLISSLSKEELVEKLAIVEFDDEGNPQKSAMSNPMLNILIQD